MSRTAGRTPAGEPGVSRAAARSPATARQAVGHRTSSRTERSLTTVPRSSPQARPAVPFAAAFRGSLLAWYRRNRRDLPWRRSPDAYRVWISEIMLQQTTVKAVIPYYKRFLDAFPTLRDLARAPLDAVLARWSGLGYYSRARHLHAAAGRVVVEHNGEFPGELRPALALPGVGHYTAAAVLSIAYGTPLAVLDGNVSRVLARLGALRGQVKSAVVARKLREMAGELLDPRRPGDFNQAMMELGATVCTPREPGCGACPVARWCRALELRLVEALPEMQARTAPRAETMIVVLVKRGGRILLRQRPAGNGLMAGLWELPGWTFGDVAPAWAGARAPMKSPPAVPKRLEARLRAEIGAAATQLHPVGEARHSIMNRRIRVMVYQARLNGPWQARPGWRWVSPGEIERLATSSLVKKALAAGQAARQSSTPHAAGARGLRPRPVPL